MTTVADEITLTRRQREVLERFVTGSSVTSIARDLHCSEATVRNHLAAMAAKIDSPHTPMRRLLIYGASLLAEGS